MARPLRNISVLGIHPVQPTAAELRATVEILFGCGLSGLALARAEVNAKKHYDCLHLLEVSLEPPEATIDWSHITQAIHDQPNTNWQVPYDEQAVDRLSGRWAFFLHAVDLDAPLSTPVGDRILPKPTPIPSHLSSIKYEVP